MFVLIRRFYTYFFQTHRRKTGIVAAILLIAFWFCLPKPLFDAPTDVDRDGRLAGVRGEARG